MRNLDVEVLNRLKLLIYPENGSLTREEEVSQYIEIFDWAEHFGFYTGRIKSNYIDRFKTYSSKKFPEVKESMPEKIERIGIETYLAIHGRISLVYGWGSDYKVCQNHSIEPLGHFSRYGYSARNNTVIDMCTEALLEAGVIDSTMRDGIYKLIYDKFSLHLTAIWCPEDVMGILKLENDEIAANKDLITRIFDEADKRHDCEIGINWDFLRIIASEMEEVGKTNDENT